MSSETRPPSMDMLDRAVGALLGTAVGDALGAGYEFGSAKLDDAARMIGGGLGGFAPGEFTDDTAMTLCIAEVAARGVALTEPAAQAAIGERFIAWARTDPPDIGISTRAVLNGAQSGDELRTRAAAYMAAGHRAGGNGALMRTAPVALAHLGDDDAIAAAASAIATLTHADPVAAESCVLWSIAIDRAVRLARLEGPRAGLHLLSPERAAWWETRIDEAEAGPPSRFRPNGYTVPALQAAWAAIRVVPTNEDAQVEAALQAAIAIGDDTDTVAAIAGALIAARWGASAIPSAYVAMVHGPMPGRPTRRVRADDLRALALRIVNHDESHDMA